MTDSCDYWKTLYQQSQQVHLEAGALPVLQMNHDLHINAHVNCATAPWVASPAVGVRRVVLERDGGEVTTRATSLVAYQAGSHFAAHSHPKGEEIWVLSGVFSDASGHYPAGSYLRNPPGSAHAPFSEEGCLIFVKLQQFDADDSVRLALAAAAAPAHATPTPPPLSRRVLFERPNERVELIHFAQAGELPADLGPRGVEILVLQGEVTGPADTYPLGTWLRCAPSLSLMHHAQAGTEIYVKSGHLGALV
jgi:quercetin dioxygenase-like cupin family protein